MMETAYTNVSYSIANNSGMNLYLALTNGSATIGSCNNVMRFSGTLPMLSSPQVIAAYGVAYGTPSTRGAFVPAGGRATGTLTFANCAAPNPGFPTAPLSVSLLIARSDNSKVMIQFPFSSDVPIRQLSSQ